MNLFVPPKLPPTRSATQVNNAGERKPRFRRFEFLHRCAHQLIRHSASRCFLSIELVILRSSRNSTNKPSLNALREALALPSAVLGPVDFSHGLQLRISAACRARRSDVQPLPMLLLQ